MTIWPATSLTAVSRCVVRLQIVTLVWMSVEGFISIGAAWHAHSPSLFAFGGDSLTELLSVAVGSSRFRLDLNEARAARMAGVLLFMLAVLMVLTSSLNFFGYREAQRSPSSRVLNSRAKTTNKCYVFVTVRTTTQGCAAVIYERFEKTIETRSHWGL